MRDFVDILADRIAADPSLTEAGLAKAAGLDNSTIRQMIRHHRHPRIDTALKICRALGETVETFMSEQNDPVVSEVLLLLDQLEPAEKAMLLAAARGLRDAHQRDAEQSHGGPKVSQPS
ncbi:DNA-binding protein [Haematobacter missouriensis]|uniref:Transcriptional regulator n=1 Tax=Haematobacter missouriensis TaxID=366616 RepID=A0A212AHX7_9RHOB|nr:helix-turn-helix transcriptional regulator [Haematobacter missouriensis]KFI34255.1 DNA-binding protein [Haematobacter missouriensis]OWJ72395.1 transcriptional regulator [Haematobacter missouriensis]OWJ81101.1 transcriptional regulator [Haematobacter missouriensis]